MNATIVSKLKKLFEHTRLLLASYNKKQHWPTRFLVVSKLSEDYRALYRQNPQAVQAQLSLFKTDYDFATNFVVNQCILTCAICKSQRYDNELTELYISASLVEHLCVSAQLNKLSKHIAFNATDTKIWRLRHQLAAKVLLSADQPAQVITRILAKLSKYKQALVSTPKVMLYDGGIIVVAVANILAMNVTRHASKKPNDFFKAIGDLYLKTPNSFTQQLLKTLIAHIGAYLPGCHVSYREQKMIYLATDSNNRHILINNNTNKLVCYQVKATLQATAVQWVCDDQRIYLNIWNAKYVNTHTTPDSHTQPLTELIAQLQHHTQYSFNGLNALLAPFPDLKLSLCQSAKYYNKEYQPAKNLKHCMSMVGLDNAPALIQGVVFERLVNTIAHPLHAFLVNRLSCLVKILGLFASKNKHLQHEHASLALFAYVHYLLTVHSTEISRKIPIENSPNKTIDTPMSHFFGVKNFDTQRFEAQLSLQLNENPWTKALLDAEQVSKKNLSDKSKLWVALKVAAQRAFKPQHALTVWQKQTLKEQLKQQGWQDLSLFYQQLQSLGLSDNI